MTPTPYVPPPRRPEFYTADDYMAHVHEAIRMGRDYWEPRTAAEIDALIRAFPERGRRYLPSAECLRYMGLQDDLGEPVEPLTDREAERIIASMVAEPVAWGKVLCACIDAAQEAKAADV